VGKENRVFLVGLGVVVIVFGDSRLILYSAKVFWKCYHFIRNCANATLASNYPFFIKILLFQLPFNYKFKFIYVYTPLWVFMHKLAEPGSLYYAFVYAPVLCYVYLYSVPFGCISIFLNLTGFGKTNALNLAKSVFKIHGISHPYNFSLKWTLFQW